MTTVFDAGGEGSAKACWALMRRARADRFWSAPRDAKRPAISVVEIGYVRRSESSTETVESDACSAYETLIARLSCDRTSTSRMFSHSICKPSSRHYLAGSGTAALERHTRTSGHSFARSDPQVPHRQQSDNQPLLANRDSQLRIGPVVGRDPVCSGKLKHASAQPTADKSAALRAQQLHWGTSHETMSWRSASAT